VIGTIAAIERELVCDGFVRRYAQDPDTEKVDGLPAGEGVFLACTGWLADAYILQGRRDDAERLFERLLSVRNDLGLMSEQYHTGTKRMLGNFPQAFSHVALVNTAHNLAHPRGPAEDRRRSDEPATVGN
jgi:GH15 family glucan-1,4-alpha-glucosidase